jgi:hypothetical protein
VPDVCTPESGVSYRGELVYGDDQDWRNDDVPLGQGVRIRVLPEGDVEVVNSLTGFPPVFCYLRAGSAIVASDLGTLIDRAAQLGQTLTADPVGLAEWIRIGQPIMHRTLVAGVQVVPAGGRLRLSAQGRWSWGPPWAPPATARFTSMAEYIDAQENAFLAAIERMDLRSTFLSLTGGLDTRAVLALLVRAERSLPCATISGRVDSLDVLGARALCRELGLEHVVVRPDDAFFADIETLTKDAVSRSGGLAGMEQAMEVYLYRCLGQHTSRLSGNLGNQVGRSGTEGVGQRQLDPLLFTEPLRRTIASLSPRHWHSQILDDGMSPTLALIQRESLFASLGNAGIGSTIAVQRSPYADRRVIELKMLEPSVDEPTESARWRDLRHRLLGPELRGSFQRSVIVKTDGPVARVPMNWGAIPAGGISPRQMLLGAGVALDALLAKESRASARLRWMRKVFRVQGLSGFRSEPFWVNPKARALVLDTMSDAASSEHPWFDVRALRSLLASSEPAGTRTLAQLLTLELWRLSRGNLSSRLVEPHYPVR